MAVWDTSTVLETNDSKTRKVLSVSNISNSTAAMNNAYKEAACWLIKCCWYCTVWHRWRQRSYYTISQSLQEALLWERQVVICHFITLYNRLNILNSPKKVDAFTCIYQKPSQAVMSAVSCTLSYRGNGLLKLRMRSMFYPLSFSKHPAIKLNGDTNHIANVSMKPQPHTSLEIAESISEIAHWHARLSLTARWSSLIQNASKYTDASHTHDGSSENHWQIGAIDSSCLSLVRKSDGRQLCHFSNLDFYGQHMSICFFE